MINYTFFKKPLTRRIQICKHICKIFKNLISILNSGKTENTQIFFEGIHAKIYAKIYLNKDLVGKGKIRHSGSMPENSGSWYKSHALCLK